VAILCSYDSACVSTISTNNFNDCRATFDGGAIYWDHKAPTDESNEYVDC